MPLGLSLLDEFEERTTAPPAPRPRKPVGLALLDEFKAQPITPVAPVVNPAFRDKSGQIGTNAANPPISPRDVLRRGILAGMNPMAPQISEAQGRAGAQFAGTLAKEAGKGVLRGGLNVVEGVGGTMRALPEIAAAGAEAVVRTPFQPLLRRKAAQEAVERAVTPQPGEEPRIRLPARGDTPATPYVPKAIENFHIRTDPNNQFEQAGRTITQASRSMQEKVATDPNTISPFDPRSKELGVEDRIVHGIKWLAGQLPEQAAYIAGNVLMSKGLAAAGAGKTAQAIGFATPTAVLEGGGTLEDTYRGLIERGVDEETARRTAGVVSGLRGIVAAAPERLSFEGIMAKMPRLSRTRRGVLGGLAEGATEGAQEWIGAGADAAAGDPKAFEGMGRRTAEAVTLGALGGGVGAALLHRGAQPPRLEPGPPPSGPIQTPSEPSASWPDVIPNDFTGSARIPRPPKPKSVSQALELPPDAPTISTPLPGEGEALEEEEDVGDLRDHLGKIQSRIVERSEDLKTAGVSDKAIEAALNTTDPRAALFAERDRIKGPAAPAAPSPALVLRPPVPADAAPGPEVGSPEQAAELEAARREALLAYQAKQNAARGINVSRATTQPESEVAPIEQTPETLSPSRIATPEPVEETKPVRAETPKKQPWEWTRQEFEAAGYKNAVRDDEGGIHVANREHADMLQSLEDEGLIEEGQNRPDLRGWVIPGTKAKDSFIHIGDLESTQGDFHKAYLKSALAQNRPIPRAVLEEYASEPWAQAALAKLAPQEAPDAAAPTEAPPIEQKPAVEPVAPTVPADDLSALSRPELVKRAKAAGVKDRTLKSELLVEAVRQREGETLEQEQSILPPTDFDPIRVDPKQVVLDPERFQFKLDTNQQGEQTPLKGEWNPLAAGNVLLWEASDGTRYAANGHHRIAHAQRLGVPQVNAQVLREVDGYTAQDARRIAAEANILDNKGTVYDQADFFRFSTGYDDAGAQARGLRGQGFTIGRFATDNTYDQFRNRGINSSQAEAIARTAPNSDRLQDAALDFILESKKKETPVEIRAFMQAVGTSGGRRKIDQPDMLGGVDPTGIADGKAMKRVVARRIAEFQSKINAAEGASKRPDQAKALGVNVKNVGKTRAELDKLREELRQWDNWHMHRDLVDSVREEAGLPPIPDVRFSIFEERQETLEPQPAKSDQSDMFSREAAQDSGVGTPSADAKVGKSNAKRDEPDMFGGARFSVGDRLRDIDKNFPVDDAEPTLLNAAKTNLRIVGDAADVFNSWPARVTAADGSEVLLKNPERGLIANRVKHLIWDNDKDRIQPEKVAWLPNVPETLRNAAVRLNDHQTGNRIFVRAYKGGTRHMVVVAPSGKVVGQESFTGKLITQFPDTRKDVRGNFVVDWEREGPGRPSGGPAPTPRASIGPEPSTRGIPGSVSDEKGGASSRLDVSAVNEAIAPIRAKWKNAPKVRIVASNKEAPVRARNRRARGAYDPKTDTVWLFADRIRTPEEAQFVFLHETIGHRGIEGVLEDAEKFYASLAFARATSVAEYAKKRGGPFKTGAERMHAAREWFADRIGGGDFDTRDRTWIKKLWDTIAAWVERMTGRKFSDRNLARLVLAANGWTENAKGAAVRSGAVRFSEGPQKSFEEMVEALLAAVQERDLAIAGLKKAEARLERVPGRIKTAERRGKTEGKRQAVKAAEDVSGQQVPKDRTIRGVVYDAFRFGTKAGKSKATGRAVEDLVDQSFRRIAREYKGDHTKWEGALDVVEKEMDDLDVALPAVKDADGRYDLARKSLKEMFGEKRYRQIRQATRGDIYQTIRFVRAKLREHQEKFYAAAIVRTAGLQNPSDFFNDTDRPGRFDLADQWRALTQPIAEQLAAVRDARSRLKYLKSEGALESEIKKSADILKGRKETLRKAVGRSDVEKMRELWDKLLHLKAKNTLIQENIGRSRKVRRAEIAAVVAEEVAENHKEIKTAKDKTPRMRGPVRDVLIDARGDQESLAMAMAGGREESLSYEILYEEVRRGAVAADTVVADAHRELRKEVTALDLKAADLERIQTDRREFTLEGHKHVFTTAQLMDLYLSMKREEARNKLMRNGGKNEAKKGLNKPGKDIIGRNHTESFTTMLDALDGRHKKLADAMFRVVGALAEGGNKTALRLFGKEKFLEEAYWGMSVDRSDTNAGKAEKIEDMKAGGYGPEQVDQFGMLRETTPHGHPLLIRNVFDVFHKHVRQMADFTHQAIPTLDALAVLNEGNTADEMKRRLGTKYGQRMRETLARAVHMKKHSDNWGTVDRWLANLHRNITTSILSFRPTSVLNNLIGGGVLMANEMGKVSPGLGAKFAATHPATVAGFWSKSNKAIREKLLANGYFYQRWEMDPARVYANLPTDEGGKRTKYRLKLRRFQNLAMHPMALAEQMNAVRAYATLTGNGYSEADALDLVDKMTRKTQNPSTALEESRLYTITRQSPWIGVMMPFFGQPAVAANILLKDAMRLSAAMKDGTGRGKAARHLAQDIAALGINNAFSAIQTAAVQAAGYGLLSGAGDDDDEERVIRYAVGRFLGDTIDNFVPGAGRLLGDPLAIPLTAAMRGDEIRARKMFGQMAREAGSSISSPLPLQIYHNLYRGIDKVWAGAEDDDGEQLLKGSINLIDGISGALGYPTGGLTQAAKIGAGLASEEESTGFRPRPPQRLQRPAPPQRPQWPQRSAP